MGNQYRQWTTKELRILKDMFKNKHTYQEIADELNRPFGSVGSKARTLGLKRREVIIPLHQQSRMLGKSNSYFACMKRLSPKTFRRARLIGGGINSIYKGKMFIDDYCVDMMSKFNELIYSDKSKEFLDSLQKLHSRDVNELKHALLKQYTISYEQARRIDKAIKRM